MNNHRFWFSRESKERMEHYDPTKEEAQHSGQEAGQDAYDVIVRTDIGRVRSSNQDAVIHMGALCGVADGMGGHQGGEIASAFTRDMLEKQLMEHEPDADTLVRAVRTVNRRLFIRSQEDGPKGMGTTLSVIWLGQESVYVAHVGDSRVYLLRDGKFKQITDDHSLVMEMVRAGVLTDEQAAVHPMRNVITRAIGTENGVDVDCLMVARRAGDLWLICTDGLHGMVSQEEMKHTLLSATPEQAADQLLQAALDAGGQDNISFVIVHDREGAQ